MGVVKNAVSCPMVKMWSTVRKKSEGPQFFDIPDIPSSELCCLQCQDNDIISHLALLDIVLHSMKHPVELEAQHKRG
jgi:hypothetical protein